MIFTFYHGNLQNIAGLNVYNILEPCYHGTVSQNTIIGNPKLPSTFRKLGKTERPLPVRKRMFGRGWPFKALVRDGIIPTWRQILNSRDLPCIVSYWSYYPLFYLYSADLVCLVYQTWTFKSSVFFKSVSWDIEKPQLAFLSFRNHFMLLMSMTGHV